MIRKRHRFSGSFRQLVGLAALVCVVASTSNMLADEPVPATPKTTAPAASERATPEATPEATPDNAEPSQVDKPSPEPRVVAPPTRRARIEIKNNATTSVYGLEATGGKFVYIFDRSSSMEGAPLASAKEQLMKSIEGLGELQQFQIIFFNHSLRSSDLTNGQNRIPFASDQSKKAASAFVKSITADGGTNRYDALLAGISMRPDVIYFLTDADDPMTDEELEKLTNKNDGHAKIQVIEFGEGKSKDDSNFLKKIAKENDGEFKYVDITRLGEAKK